MYPVAKHLPSTKKPALETKGNKSSGYRPTWTSVPHSRPGCQGFSVIKQVESNLASFNAMAA